jgi:type IV pilus assembly protein PilN
MIRINLLAERKQKKQKIQIAAAAAATVETERKKAPALLITLAAVIIGTLLVIGALYFALSWNVDSLKEELQKNNVLIAESKKKIEEVKKFEELNRAIESKTNLIKTLKKDQSTPVKLLDNISKLLPNDAWITSVSYNNPRVIVEGVAFTNFEVVAFIENLKKAPEYSDVYLEESKQGVVDTVDVYIFKLNFNTRT